MRRRLAGLTVLLAVLTGLSACGSDSESIDGLTVSGDFGKQPTVEVDGLKVDKSESAVIIQGDGDALSADGAAMLQTLIANGKTGATLQSTYGSGDPQKAVIGELPEPISKALTGEKIGSRIAIALPTKELFGDQGAPQAGLAPDDDIVIVFDVIDKAEPPLTEPKGTTVKPPADAPKVVEEGGQITGIDFSDAPAKPPADLQVIPLVEGDGPAVKDGDSINAQYVGQVWGADEPFDNTMGKPTPFTISKGGLIDGWAQGLDGVKAGSRVMLIIPPELGYGAKGGGPGSNIPANATLVFVIDVLEVNG
jgi:peptidylprolyl isomerase